jgi:hypothetical protein
VSDLLRVYDEAFEALTAYSDPTRFRDFLLSAPTLFAAIGERLGSIQHIVSFWRFHVTGRRATRISSVDLADVLSEFEESLGHASERAAVWV